VYVWKQLSPSVEHQLAQGYAFGMTDTGTTRSSNEDNFLIDEHLGLIAVADGMGGHEAGEVASSDALTSMAHFLRSRAGIAPRPRFQPRACDFHQSAHESTWNDDTRAAMITIHDAVEFANQSMYQTNLENRRGDGGGMGTTLTGMWQPVPNGPAFVFHVGDTRLYRLRQGRLDQLTRDQTLYQHALDQGASHNLPPRNLLMQALGPASGIRPELQTHLVAPGDLFMLCSDGLHGALEHGDIAAVLAEAAASDLGATCAQLIEMAKQDGSRDNITVVLFHCRQ
jgi:serine/threonine protein phosphatase PrpC